MNRVKETEKEKRFYARKSVSRDERGYMDTVFLSRARKEKDANSLFLATETFQKRNKKY